MINRLQIYNLLAIAKKGLSPTVIGSLLCASILIFIGLSVYKNVDSTGGNPALGQQNYTVYCSSCHGEKGHGDGIAASALTHPPRNIIRRLEDIITYDSLLIQGPVMNGRVNRGMPAFKEILTEEDIKDIFAYLRAVNES